MSHLALWQRSVALNKPHIVFEDDAFLRHDIKRQFVALVRQPVDWDIILIGYNTDAAFELNVAPGMSLGGGFSLHYPTAQHLDDFVKSTNPVGLQRLLTAFGTSGYAVTPKGADFLIRACFPLDNRPVQIRSTGRAFPSYGLDCMMNTLYDKMNAYVCVAPLVMTPNDHSQSTVQQPSTN